MDTGETMFSRTSRGHVILQITCPALPQGQRQRHRPNTRRRTAGAAGRRGSDEPDSKTANGPDSGPGSPVRMHGGPAPRASRVFSARHLSHLDLVNPRRTASHHATPHDAGRQMLKYMGRALSVVLAFPTRVFLRGVHGSSRKLLVSPLCHATTNCLYLYCCLA
jgi:hypothetical protein